MYHGRDVHGDEIVAAVVVAAVVRVQSPADIVMSLEHEVMSCLIDLAVVAIPLGLCDVVAGNRPALVSKAPKWPTLQYSDCYNFR